MHNYYPYVARSTYDGTTGVNDAWSVHVNGLGKDNTDNPYLIPNEWIAAKIAHFLGIPVPPFAIMQNSNRRPRMFVSISFARETTPPDASPQLLWERHPQLCTGILAFDILIANSDRHAGNLKVDNPARPKRVHVFDHDRALFHCVPKEGRKRLKELEGRLGITGGSVSQGNCHCLINEIDTATHFGYWANRIQTMPRWYIEESCTALGKCGATPRELKCAVEFLKRRCRDFDRLILDNKSEFPNVLDWKLVL